jgi:hypothetical protein
VLPRRRLERRQEIDREWILAPDKRPEDREEKEDPEQHGGG